MVHERVKGKPHITMPTKRFPVFVFHLEKGGNEYFGDFKGSIRDLQYYWQTVVVPRIPFL